MHVGVKDGSKEIPTPNLDTRIDHVDSRHRRWGSPVAVTVEGEIAVGDYISCLRRKDSLTAGT